MSPLGTSRSRLQRFDPATNTVSDLTLIGNNLARRIPAGEIVFMKYETGAPWAGRCSVAPEHRFLCRIPPFDRFCGSQRLTPVRSTGKPGNPR